MLVGMKINAQRKQEYYQKGYWGDATLLEYWNMSVLKVPQKTAVVDTAGYRLTYAALDKAAGRVARWLTTVGVQAGDIVSVQIPAWTEFTLLYIACLKAGAVINPILPNHRAEELGFTLEKCESKVLFIPAVFRNYEYQPMAKALAAKLPSLQHTVVIEKGYPVDNCLTLSRILHEYEPLSEPVRRGADDLAAVLFTSGTESFPKGVMLTHNTIIASIKSFAAVLHLTGNDIMLMPAPVAHATGFHHGITTPFLLGGTSVLQDIFTPKLSLALIEREGCTYSMGSTPVIHDMLCAMKKHQYTLSTLRFFLCGGAPSPRHILQDAWKAGFKVISVYGSTESVPHTVSSPEAPRKKIITTDGCAVPGVDVRVVDSARNSVATGIEGEEASRGPNVFVGYLKEVALTNQVLDDEGWYYGGDLCVMDAEGYIKITGRKKDIIIRGGENISSTEVEGILLQHAGISDAAVVSMPDPRLGERSCAYVVLHEGVTDVNLENVAAFFKSKHIAKYKYPERIEIVATIPRNPSGKIQKFLLRRLIREIMEKEAAFA